MTPIVHDFHDLLLLNCARSQGVNSEEWRRLVLQMRIMRPPTGDLQNEIRRIMGVLNEISNPDVRRRCLQEYVGGLFAQKSAGRKAQNKSEELIRRNIKIFWTIEELRGRGCCSKGDAMKAILENRRKYGFDNLPATLDALDEADKQARAWLGLVRIPIRRRKRAARD